MTAVTIDVKTPRCIIVGAGENDVPVPSPRPDDFLIAADGGGNVTASLDLHPHLIIGDFDSLTSPAPTGTEILRLPAEKDDTDMTSAVKAGWSRGYRHFDIYGGLGKRLDHTFANVQLLSLIAAHGGFGMLRSSQTTVAAIGPGHVRLAARSWDREDAPYVSVFSLTNRATGVTEQGLKYRLDGAVLTNTAPLGVSNELVGTEASISVTSGLLLITLPAGTPVEKVVISTQQAESLGDISTQQSSLIVQPGGGER